MITKTDDKVQDADRLVGRFFVSFEFGDLCWRGRVVSRKDDRFRVVIEPATFFALTGLGGVLLDGERVKRKSVRIRDTGDWRFFRTAEERDTWAALYLSDTQ